MDYYSNLVDIEPEIIDCMNYKELQKVAKDNGLKAGGKKEILRQSILDLKVWSIISGHKSDDIFYLSCF